MTATYLLFACKLSSLQSKNLSALLHDRSGQRLRFRAMSVSLLRAMCVASAAETTHHGVRLRAAVLRARAAVRCERWNRANRSRGSSRGACRQARQRQRRRG